VPRALAQVSRYAAALLTVALITQFYRHETSFAVTTVVLTYLLCVLISSALWGLGISVFMSATATLALDYYFFPPIGRFTISDPQDWASLLAFLITSVIGSELSARARREAEEANRRRTEIEHLYEFSQYLMKARDQLELLNEIPRQIVRIFHADAAALYLPENREIYRAGVDAPQLEANRLKSAAMREDPEMDPSREIYFAPIRFGLRVIGSVAISGSLASDKTLEAIGTLAASAIDRAQAIELLGKAEAVRESERLKSVLLDAVTHDFKTPLTSIKASATSLLENLNFNRDQRKELLIVIDEECDRINRLIGQTNEMARLEAGEVTLQFAPLPVNGIITAALEDCESVKTSRAIHTEGNGLRCKVYADPAWARKVFTNIIQNADLYSYPGEPIRISAEQRDGFVVFSVSDKGAGIEDFEKNHIFDRFYRGKGQRHRIPGTGMGLPIAKAIIEAHGGTIGVVSRVGAGSVFTFSLPIDLGGDERC
jgi:two-component system, OmpR family, sensor histidine kinase KdpD